MADFLAKIIADLDLTKAQSQLNSFKNTNNKIDIDVNIKGNFATYLNQIKSQFANIGNGLSNSINASVNNIDLSKTKGEIAKLSNALKNFGFNDSSIQNITSRLNDLKVTVTGITHQMNGRTLTVQVDGIDSMNRAVSAVQVFSQKTGDLIGQSSRIKTAFKEMFTDMDVSKLNSSISALDAQFTKLSGYTNKQSAALRQLKLDLSNIGTFQDLSQRQAEFDRITQAVKRLSDEYKIAKAESDKLSSSHQLLTSKSILNNQIETWMRKNTKAAKIYSTELESLKNSLAKVTNAQSLSRVSRDFENLKTSAAAAGNLGRSFFGSIVNNMTKLSPLFGLGTVINRTIYGLKDMYNNVVNIDTAMTELKKVTDETDKSYSNFLNSASKRSVDIGTTISNYINSTASFARLGYSLQEAQKLSEVANIYKVVGDEIDSIDEASSSVISTLQAFGIEADNAMSAVDKFNEVGNNFAISSGGIGEALTRSASSMATANNTLDETIALITAANTVVQNPTTVGTAFKTISMRIRGAKTE